MKKKDTDLRDIYHARNSSPEPPPPIKIAEVLQQELRRQQLFTLFSGLLTIGLAAILLPLIIRDYLPASHQDAFTSEKRQPLSVHKLPEDEQWVLEYRQIALQADSSEPAGAKAVSAKWIKNTAYHIIMGEQALLQDDALTAQNHLKTAADTFPEMTGLNRNLGAAYLTRQDFQKAAALLQKALKEDPSKDVLNNLGAAAIGIGDYIQAEALLLQALQREPELAGCYKNLALLYQKTGRTSEATASFDHYFRLNPQDTQMIESYVIYLVGAGRIHDAAEFLDRLQGADLLATQRLLAKVAAQDADADRAVRALHKTARVLTPRQVIAEMHENAFEKIAKTDAFQTLLHQLELAAVSLSTNFVSERMAP
jgi:Tfp pilus assembly protein PilF